MKCFSPASLRPFLLLTLASLAVGPAHAQTATVSGQTLPPGVQSLYAHQGENTIIAYATPDGYAHVRALVKHLDGDLDIIRTDVSLVQVPPAMVHALGGAAALSDTALLAAFQAGRLPASDHIRLTTREDTPIEALLRNAGNGSIPLSLVPREDEKGTLSIELLQPAALSMTGGSDDVNVARLPDAPNGTLRLLFLTPVLLPGETHAGR